ncbi:MAG: hypothetical protein NTW54_10115 [Bacteroidetes bacterium]|nr:hypothetical protein [Bacteroidota bacterium]
MKIFKSGLIILSLILLSSSCKVKHAEGQKGSSKPVSFRSMTSVVFGWGGGFTGMVESYSLSKDGTLKLGDEVKKKIDAKSMRLTMGLVKKVNFYKTPLNDPGNLYFFMVMKGVDNEQRLIWNEQTQLPEEIKNAYDALVKLTK